MKIRSGFVSNSSSSSFVIIAPNKEHDFVRTLIAKKTYDDDYESYYDIIYRKNGEVLVLGNADQSDPLFYNIPEDLESHFI